MKASTLIQRIQSHTLGYGNAMGEANRALTEANSEDLRLEQGILDQLVQIASIQLCDDNALPRDVKTILDTRETAIEDLRTSLKKVEANIGDAIEARQSIKNSVDAIEGAIHNAMSTDELYITAVIERDSAKLALTLASPGYAEIEDEVKAKLPAFRKNKLFSYLHRMNFGEAGYKGGKLSLFLDRWVASLVRYRENKANYDTLQAMSDANSEHLLALEVGATACDDRVEVLHNAYAATYKFNEAMANLDLADQQISNLKDVAKSVHQQLNQFALKEDSYHRKARDLIVGQLQQQPIQELLAKCAQTPDQSDDAHALIVKNLMACRDQVGQQIVQLREDRDTKHRLYERAKVIERKMRNSRYNSSKYRYSDSLDLESLLAGYMAGRLSTEALTRDVETAARHIPDPTPSGGGFGGGGYGSSGGFGGGSSSTSSGFGGSSFSTSDSF